MVLHLPAETRTRVHLKEVLFPLYCTPCTVHPVLYTLYCTPCTVHPVLYTNDCTPIQQNSKDIFLKYADVICLAGFICLDDNTSYTTYEEEVQRLTSWCSENYLQFKVKKTKEIVIDFRTNRNPTSPLTVNGETVEYTTRKVDKDCISSRNCKSLRLVKVCSQPSIRQ